MPITLTMPQLSPTMTEGRLAKWLKQAGDTIRAGDVVAEVETDKATMEVEASDDGILHQIVGEVGADLPVGAPIAVLRGKDETVPPDFVPTGKTKMVVEATATPAATPPLAPPPTTPTAPEPVHTTTAPATNLAAVQSGGNSGDFATQMRQKNDTFASSRTQLHTFAPKTDNSRTKASPLAKRLAEQQHISLAGHTGSGPGGRIVAADIPHLANRNTSQKTITRQADSLTRLSPMRKAIAARLTQSKQSVPHFYLKVKANLEKALDLREQLNAHYAASGGPKVSVNDLIIKASALALADYPAANASWHAEGLLTYGNVDISVAVAIDGGLITPIVANADQKPLAQISQEVKSLAAAARAGKLKPEQYEGGTFSISNLGMYGIEEFAAIINPPQAAILAVGKASQDNLLALTLSVDHRVIDGALGAELLTRIQHYLENPISLVLA